MDGGDEVEYLDIDQQQVEVGGGGYCVRLIFVYFGGGYYSFFWGRFGQFGKQLGGEVGLVGFVGLMLFGCVCFVLCCFY